MLWHAIRSVAKEQVMRGGVRKGSLVTKTPETQSAIGIDGPPPRPEVDAGGSFYQKTYTALNKGSERLAFLICTSYWGKRDTKKKEYFVINFI